MNVLTIIFTVGGNVVALIAGLVALLRKIKSWLLNMMTEPLAALNTHVSDLDVELASVKQRVSYMEGKQYHG